MINKELVIKYAKIYNYKVEDVEKEIENIVTTLMRFGHNEYYAYDIINQGMELVNNER